MSLSLVSLLSQDISALWLLLKTQAGVWMVAGFSGTREGVETAGGCHRDEVGGQRRCSLLTRGSSAGAAGGQEGLDTGI